jgi:putative glutamine amidotransferase
VKAPVRIGISASFFHADPQRPIFKGMTLQYIEQNLAHWLMQRDVLAFMVPSPDGSTRRATSKVTLDAYADALDGLVLMGGSDVSPESYGEQAIKPEWNGDRVRDQYEIGLLKAFMARAKPVLGVCRGAQVINVAMGGTLWQDITSQVPHGLNHRNWAIYEKNCHATSLVPGSGLARLYPGVATVKTNSIHHQAVKELGRNLVVEAWSEPDRLVEAIRWTGPSYVFAVQWHPEFHLPGDASYIDDTPILDDFLATTARHKAAAYAL